ncbi:hypothetical protein JCM8547_008819 [Rhodosporidiobolus lusitaniae]
MVPLAASTLRRSASLLALPVLASASSSSSSPIPLVSSTSRQRLPAPLLHVHSAKHSEQGLSAADTRTQRTKRRRLSKTRVEDGEGSFSPRTALPTRRTPLKLSQPSTLGAGRVYKPTDVLRRPAAPPQPSPAGPRFSPSRTLSVSLLRLHRTGGGLLSYGQGGGAGARLGRGERRTFLSFSRAASKKAEGDKDSRGGTGRSGQEEGSSAGPSSGEDGKRPAFSNYPSSSSSSSTSPPSSSSAPSSSSGSNSPPLPRPRGEHHNTSFTPRPPTAYGEINVLARHPTLHDPLRKPRLPIVLCHGLYGFDVRGPGFFRLHYWGDLLKILRGQIGAEVFVTAVPGTGSVKKRAQVLHRALEDTRALLNRDINFIAHSMGGLDARYLISNIRPTLYHPRSLTTLCTPHRGSEFMAWCRANIGIGTEFDQNEPLDLRPITSSSLENPYDTSIPLPYSLKSPILSREQVSAAKKAAAAQKLAGKVKDAATSLLPFNLSVSVTSYLLDLLDSPAYANLTPSFLRDVFNPSTPDLEGVKYYSIAARTEKIPIWHPLWLPKLVLDGAEAARISKGVAAPPAWRGNDGLVSVDSARWGEFLGTFDACDHWEMRGSSGLSSAEASKAAVEEATRSEIRETREPREGGSAEKVEGKKEEGGVKEGKKGEDAGWQWQDVYASVAHSVGAGSGEKGGKDKPMEEGKKDGSAPAKEEKDDTSHDAAGLASAASWIVRQLPGSSVSSDSSASSFPSSDSLSPAGRKALDTAASSVSSAASSAASHVSSAAHVVADNVVNNRATRLLYGAPGLSSSASSSSSSSGAEGKDGKAGAAYEPPAKPDKFSLEKMTVALCRKLYNEGF